MSIRHTFRAATLAAAVISLAGCQGPNLAPSPGSVDPYPAPYNDPEITVLDAALRPWLGFQPATTVVDDETPMQVQVPCRNMTDKNYSIDYRFIFFDRRGMEVKPVMNWRNVTFQERQLIEMTAGAMSTAAVRYRLEVRWAR